MRYGAGVLLLLVVLGIERDALAHAILLESTPQSMDVLPEAKRLDLRFSSRLEPAFAQVRLIGPSGEHVPLRAAVSREEPDRLTAALPGLDPGLYMVSRRVLSLDGRLSHGRFSFRIVPRVP